MRSNSIYWSMTDKSIIRVMRIIGIVVISASFISMNEDIFYLKETNWVSIVLRLLPILYSIGFIGFSFINPDNFIKLLKVIIITGVIIISIPVSIISAMIGGFNNLYFLGIIQLEFGLISFIHLSRRDSFLIILFLNSFFIVSNIVIPDNFDMANALSVCTALIIFALISIAAHHVFSISRESIAINNQEKDINLERIKHDLIMSEKKFYELFYSSDLPLLIIEKNRIVDCNKAFLKMLGFQDRELVLNLMPADLSPDYQPDGYSSIQMQQEYYTKSRERGSISFYWKYQKSNGKEIDTRINLVSIPLKGKSVLYAIIDDISEQIVAEQKLKQSEETANAFIHSIKDIAILIDIDGVILKHNKLLPLSVGSKIMDMTGSNIYDYFDSETAERRRSFSKVIINTGKSHTFEDTRDNRIFIISQSPIFNSNSKIEAIAIHVRDVTKERKSEQDLKKYQKKLEQIVNERTKDLIKANNDLTLRNTEITEQKEALQVLNIELKEVNAAKDKFFSIIAHDLRNPLINLRDATNILLDSMADLGKDDITVYLRDINSSASGVYSLLENLLNWSRAQTGKIQFVREDFDLRILVDAVLAIHKLQSEAKNIKLINNVPEGIIVPADPNITSTIIRNIVSNSLKFTANGGEIKVDMNEMDNIFQVVISDNGIGMSRDTLLDIFSIDKQISTPGTNDEKGTGLGLIICRDLAKINHGDLKIESEEGRGTHIIITLPKKA